MHPYENIHLHIYRADTPKQFTQHTNAQTYRQTERQRQRQTHTYTHSLTRQMPMYSTFNRVQSLKKKKKVSDQLEKGINKVKLI